LASFLSLLCNWLRPAMGSSTELLLHRLILRTG
jgi:hypothetical protein